MKLPSGTGRKVPTDLRLIQSGPEIAVFQALGNGLYSLIVSVCRQLVVLLPAAYIFAHAFGLHAVWWSCPVAELASLATSLYLLKKIYHSHLKDL